MVVNWRWNLKRWYWRKFVPYPQPNWDDPDDDFFERVVEWCMIREENHAIYQCAGTPPGGC
jgi:hypothetical protein